MDRGRPTTLSLHGSSNRMTQKEILFTLSSQIRLRLLQSDDKVTTNKLSIIGNRSMAKLAKSVGENGRNL
jgi:hypothetical protein